MLRWIKVSALVLLLSMYSFTQIVLTFGEFQVEVKKVPFAILYKLEDVDAFNAVTIDSLFVVTIAEIEKIPIYGWIDRTFGWVEPSSIECKQITIPTSLYSMFSKDEQDSISYLIGLRSKLIFSDTLFAWDSPYGVFLDMKTRPDEDEIHCSLFVRIEENEKGELSMYFNDTPYLLIKRLDGTYLLHPKENDK